MEYFDVCDLSGNPTGEIVERSVAHRDGIPHRTAHVWIVRKSVCGYDVLLQKRSLLKDSFPGKLDISSAGHIPAGCEPLDSALRELSEELGLQAAPEDLRFLGLIHTAQDGFFHGMPFLNRETASVYACDKPVDISSLTLQEEELSGVEWHDFAETLRLCRLNDERFCAPVQGLQLLGRWLGLPDAE